MAEKSTIARPYAQAAFDLAKDAKDLKKWSDMLALVAAVTVDPTMAAIVNNPQYQTQEVIDLLLKICGKKLTKTGQNFVQVVAINKRLNVFSEIANSYEIHRANEEGCIEAEVISAFKLKAAQQKAIIAALKKRLGREINLTTIIDETLIGGTIIRAGDMVIDGSITGQLDKLAHALNT